MIIARTYTILQLIKMRFYFEYIPLLSIQWKKMFNPKCGYHDSIMANLNLKGVRHHARSGQ